MEVQVGDIIETEVGGPYKVINIKDGLITFKMKNGIGMTIYKHIIKLTKNTELNCEYSGLPSVKAYES